MANVIKDGVGDCKLSELLTFETAYLECLNGAWRLWDDEPTVEQMEATPWGNNENGTVGNNWRIVEKDGNPTCEGDYDVILIYDEWKDGAPTGKLRATRDSRWFGDAVKAGCENWVMKDQPSHGLVWTEETGSYPDERVYAWLPEREYPEIELPEGVMWE